MAAAVRQQLARLALVDEKLGEILELMEVVDDANETLVNEVQSVAKGSEDYRTEQLGFSG